MRLHLFEWHDQAWFPISLRTAMTSYLTAAYEITSFPKLWASCLSKGISRDGATEIVDLGSGSGGPVRRVVKELEKCGFKVSVTLTDLYPNVIGLRLRSVGRVQFGIGRNQWMQLECQLHCTASALCSRCSTTFGHKRRGGSCATPLSSDARSAFSREHRERRLPSRRRYSFLCLFFCSRHW